MSVFSRVLVAVDGSENAARALAVAVSLCQATGAELVVVHAVGLLEEQSLHEVGVDDRLLELQYEVAGWCEAVRTAGIDPQVEVVPGSPVPALVTTAERLRADLVVVGSRGVGGLGGRRLGSTSQGLVSESRIPVLVVPA